MIDDETTEIDARPPCPLLVPAASAEYMARIAEAARSMRAAARADAELHARSAP
jgi:hypothetical protein